MLNNCLLLSILLTVEIFTDVCTSYPTTNYGQYNRIIILEIFNIAYKILV